MNGTEAARLLGYRLDFYPVGRLRKIESAYLPCVIFCLLVCVRSTMGRFSALDALFFQPLSPRRELAYSASFAVADSKTEIVTLQLS